MTLEHVIRALLGQAAGDEFLVRQAHPFACLAMRQGEEGCTVTCSCHGAEDERLVLGHSGGTFGAWENALVNVRADAHPTAWRPRAVSWIVSNAWPHLQTIPPRQTPDRLWWGCRMGHPTAKGKTKAAMHRVLFDEVALPPIGERPFQHTYYTAARIFTIHVGPLDPDHVIKATAWLRACVSLNAGAGEAFWRGQLGISQAVALFEQEIGCTYSTALQLYPEAYKALGLGRVAHEA